MAFAALISGPGGSETLKISEVKNIRPAKGEIRIKHTVIGVNYIDVYHRSGLYKMNYPLIPGVEAAGLVEDIGPETEGFKIGDRVCYGTATHISGAYATSRNIPAKYVVKTPQDIPDDVAATMMVKGMTAHYLLYRTFTVKEDIFILVHAAAGGVGTYLCQWGKGLGAKVIGTVGSEEKAKWAKENGCDHVINYRKEDFLTRTMEITQGKGVPVVYDSVGKDTFHKSIECLMPLGLAVSFGQSSGNIPPIEISQLAKRSTFITRPALGYYKSERNELVMSAAEIFEALRKLILKPRITHRIPLKNAAEAHRLLESRQTMGSIVLIP